MFGLDDLRGLFQPMILWKFCTGPLSFWYTCAIILIEIHGLNAMYSVMHKGVQSRLYRQNHNYLAKELTVQVWEVRNSRCIRGRSPYKPHVEEES